MNLLKYALLLIATVGQVIGILLLFINLVWAGIFYIAYFIALILLMVVLIMERKKEKEEDDRNDYRDY